MIRGKEEPKWWDGRGREGGERKSERTEKEEICKGENQEKKNRDRMSSAEGSYL